MNRELYVTVSQINAYIKNILDNTDVLQNVYICGEISNFKHHWSGHMYFSLKDETGILKAVMFKGANYALSFVPENGMSVIARGKISVYPRDGVYQLYIEEMIPNGEGDLHVAFEKLKQKLMKEGLFEEYHKKSIPRFPKTVGVVTSETGAAVRDIINILSRRYKAADILLYPVAVQGAGAAEEIAAAIEYFNSKMCADVLIVGRGGGSIEDLWAFNEEIVARAIFASEIPVISAVGHETDFTIADFVADMRAPTPSAAAELAVPDMSELIQSILFREKKLCTDIEKKVSFYDEKLRAGEKLLSPTGITLRLDNMSQRLDRGFDMLLAASKTKRDKKEMHLINIASKLDALSPLKTLSRGFSRVVDESGKTVTDAAKLNCGDKISVSFSSGSAQCTVDSINADNN